MLREKLTVTVKKILLKKIDSIIDGLKLETGLMQQNI